MGWEVDDIEVTVRELRARGVVFEEYDFPGLRRSTGSQTSRATTQARAAESAAHGFVTARATCSGLASRFVAEAGWFADGAGQVQDPFRRPSTASASEPVRRLRVRIFGEGQQLGRFDPEHGGRIFARAEHAVTDVEMPLAAVLGLVGVGEPLQAFRVGDPDRCALDDHIEAPSPAVVAGGQGHPAVVLEIAGLLLAKPGAEMDRCASMTPISGVTCGRPSARTVVSQ